IVIARRFQRDRRRARFFAGVLNTHGFVLFAGTGDKVIALVVGVPVDWFAVIFNPSFPYRLLHMSVAAFLSSAMFVGASAAWHLL
ncbi:cytochrome ubiquinol oxidase subunit I, partial [Salmonella enterica subsp. enterica serovar Anatum]|nr:cytochrome ubiquinol oxidase subunit I [Salmonella enterica subsp. enterica serovar Anatum]